MTPEEAEAAARRFEEHEPDPATIRDAAPLRLIADRAEELADAVTRARVAGHAWGAVAAMLGTSASTARQRYGTFRPRLVRWEHGWEIHVPGVGVTQCEDAGEAVAMAEDLIERRTGLQRGQFDVRIDLRATMAAGKDDRRDA